MEYAPKYDYDILDKENKEILKIYEPLSQELKKLKKNYRNVQANFQKLSSNINYTKSVSTIKVVMFCRLKRGMKLSWSSWETS